MEGQFAHNDTCNAVLGVADLLEVLRNNGEDTGRQRHVEEAVVLRATLLNLLEVLLEALEGLILVVLTRNVGAEPGELLELLLDLLCGGLYVRLDASNVFFVVHLGAGISDNLDILGEELVSILNRLLADTIHVLKMRFIAYKTEKSRVLS